MSDDKLTDHVNKRSDNTDVESDNDGDYSLDLNLDKPVVDSSLLNQNGEDKSSGREDKILLNQNGEDKSSGRDNF